MLKRTSVPEANLHKAKRKIGAVLEDLEQTTSSEVRDVDLEKVVDEDPSTGIPQVHDAVDIEVQPRPQRKWLK